MKNFLNLVNIYLEILNWKSHFTDKISTIDTGSNATLCFLWMSNEEVFDVIKCLFSLNIYHFLIITYKKSIIYSKNVFFFEISNSIPQLTSHFFNDKNQVFLPLYGLWKLLNDKVDKISVSLM